MFKRFALGVTSLLFIICIFTSITMTTLADANEQVESIPSIVDFNSRTFIRSDGSVWVLSGEQLIPTQVAGISNAVKLITESDPNTYYPRQNEVINTTDGKNYLLTSVDVDGIVKPFELPMQGEIKKLYGSYLITDQGEVYTINGGSYQNDEIHITKYSLPFQVEDMLTQVFSYQSRFYSDELNMYLYDTSYFYITLYLTTEEEIWMKQGESWTELSLNSELMEIGESGVRYSTLFQSGSVDNQGTLWELEYSNELEKKFKLTPINTITKFNQISYTSEPIIGITKDLSPAWLMNRSWVPIPGLYYIKVLQMEAMSNGAVKYITEDHDFYIKYTIFDNAVLIAKDVSKFSIDGGLIYLKQDGKLATWNYENPFIIQDPIPVYVNDEVIGMPKGAWLINNTTYLPLRSIFTNLGATVNWDNTNKIASFSAKINGVSSNMTIDYKNQEVYLNDVLIPFDQELFIADNSAFVPLRLVSEGLGAKVLWDSETKSISIDSK